MPSSAPASSIWLERGRRLSRATTWRSPFLLPGCGRRRSLGYFYRGLEVLARQPPAPAVTQLWVPVLICGGAMIVAGLLDHWQLKWVLGPAVEEPA